MNHRIRPDVRGWILERRTVTTERSKSGAGVESWGDTVYPASLEHAATMLLERAIKDRCGDVPEIRDLIVAVKDAVTEVKAAVAEAVTAAKV